MLKSQTIKASFAILALLGLANSININTLQTNQIAVNTNLVSLKEE